LPATPPPQPDRLTAQHVDDRHPVVRHNELPPVNPARNQPSTLGAPRVPGRGTVATTTQGTGPATTGPGSANRPPNANRPSTQPPIQRGGSPVAPPASGPRSSAERPSQPAPVTAPPAKAVPADAPPRVVPSTPTPRAQAESPAHRGAERPFTDNGRGHNARADSSAVESPKTPRAAIESPRPTAQVYETPKRQAESSIPRTGETFSDRLRNRELAPVTSPSIHGGSSMHIPPSANGPASTPHASSPPPQTERYSAPSAGSKSDTSSSNARKDR
jgi:hypothetical protein